MDINTEKEALENTDSIEATVADSISQELVFIDTDVDNYQQLLNDIISQSDEERNIEVILLDNDRDGIEQISEALLNFQNLDAVHLISHGSDGSVDIGNTTLDADTLSQNLMEVSAWGDAFTDEGDFLIYGCNLAATEDGQSLIKTISILTQADIAASDDLTGQADLGGDWELEYNAGNVESDIVISTQLQEQWGGVLAKTIYESNSTVSNPIEIKSDNTQGQTFSHTSGNGDYDVNQLTLQLIKDADAASQNITVTLRDNWNGTILGTATISSDTLTTSYSSYDFSFADATLTDGTTYFIQVTTDSLLGKVYVGSDNSGTYTHGDQIDKNGVAIGGKDLAFSVSEVAANQFIVSTTADSGAGSLRQAIIDANAQANSGQPDTITFDIGADGSLQTIDLLSPLDAITEAVFIDGHSQYGALTPTTPLIELNGTSAPGDGIRLNSGSGGSTIQGLIINNFSDDGIDIASGSAGNIIISNWIGLDNTGNAAAANGSNGIEIDSSGNVLGGTTDLERNVISGNNAGIRLQNSTAINNVIQGNYIGTNASGSAAIANSNALFIVGAASSNTIGGAAGAGNVISGNSGDGFVIRGTGTSDNKIKGNIIGLDANGTSSLGNGGDGIHIMLGATNTIVGGSTDADRNIISANSDGIHIDDSGTDGNIIQGNYIGTDITGTVDLGNIRNGIRLTDNASNTTIGGSGAGEGNLISGNEDAGILLGTPTTAVSNVTIKGNLIGTDVTGALNLGNTEAGIRAEFGTNTNIRIGGTETNAGNTIAYNGFSGVIVESPVTGVALLGNSIFSNTLQGIDLGDDGTVASNDEGDGDTGANNLQNFPVLTSSTTTNGDTTIVGAINTTASTTYRIEFFSSSAGDGTGYGEAKTYLGFTTVTTDGSGNGTINKVLTDVEVNSGYQVTSTATVDLGAGNYGDTSEFALNVVAVNTSPIAHWTFDTDATDSSGYSHNGALTNDAAIDTAAVTNKVGEGKLSLDGTDDRVNLPVSLGALTEGSISVWFNTTDAGYNPIFSVSDSNSDSDFAHLEMSNGKLLFEVVSAGAPKYTVLYNTQLNDGNWHHVSITVDGDGNKMYVDGAQILAGDLLYFTGGTSNTEFFDDVNNADTVEIGAYSTSSISTGRFNGLIDDVQIHDYALTSERAAILATVNAAPTFGTAGDGIVTTDVNGSTDLASDSTLQADGKILVAGYS